MAKSATCSRCGLKILNGLTYNCNGKTFCFNCYTIANQELETIEQERQKLYQYIRQLFSLSEVPEEIIVMINREVARGKKYKGIRLTIRYYYEILEYPHSDFTLLPWVVASQYENARAYEAEVNRVRKVNEGVDLTPKIRTIQLTPSDLTNHRKKKSCNIEDL